MSPPIQKCLGLTGKDELEEIKNERHIIYKKKIMDARDDAVEEELIKHMLIYQKCGLQESNEGRI